MKLERCLIHVRLEMSFPLSHSSGHKLLHQVLDREVHFDSKLEWRPVMILHQLTMRDHLENMEEEGPLGALYAYQTF